MLFWVQVFQCLQAPGFSGSSFLKVRVQGLGPDFRNSQDKQVYVTTKKLSEETEQDPSEPNSLAFLFKVYL